MKIDNIIEANSVKTICIYPGRFQPPHRGHAQTYASLAKQYGAENTFIATSNKVEPGKSPFNFEEKKQLLIAAGVPASQIVQVVNTYAAKEITDRYDISNTVVVYAVGQKDMEQDARFSSFTKKDGSPAYLQKMVDSPETADKHAYLVVAPTVEFSIGRQKINSASQIRQMFAGADAAGQAAIVDQLYGKAGAKVLPLLQSKLSAVTESRRSRKLSESISGKDMLKIFLQTHHKAGENPEMEKFITDHDWGIQIVNPDQLPDIDDDVYFDDPFARVVDIDMDHVRDVAKDVRRGGKIDPIIMGPNGSIIDGNHRAQAAKALSTTVQAYVPMAKSTPATEEVLKKDLNAPTPTVKELAAKYRVTIPKINHALGQGVKVEFEHTRDIDVAREIALDHLGEDLHYYEKLASVNLESDDEMLDEINLKAIHGFANDPRLDDVKMGWELEMIWPDHDDGRHSDDDYETESEPDWEADESINDDSVNSFRRDIINFFAGEHNSRGEVNSVLDGFIEDYHNHLMDKWDELYNDEDDDVRRQVADHIESGEDEATALDKAKEDWVTDNQDDMLSDYLSSEVGVESMHGFMENTGNDLSWPVWTEPDYGYSSDKGELTREDLKNMFQREFRDMLIQDGFRVEAINSPHKNKKMDTWYFEPDGSLNPQEENEGGVELTTPPIPYKRSMEYLQKVFDWAKSNRAWTGTDGDTGFHMSFSLPAEQMKNVDWVKMILMGGDDRVLRDFDRWAGGNNNWAKSALKHIRDETARGGDLNSDMIIDAIKTGLTPDAKREAMKHMSRGKYTSVHPKGGDDNEGDFTYVEFRSAGGDALGQIDKVQTAALQYARSIILAADPNADRQEYAKKLYKMVSKVKAEEPGLKALKDFADGKIDKETLKFKLSKAAVARGQSPKFKPSGNIYVFKTKSGGSRRGPDIEIIAPTLMTAIPQAQAEARNKDNKNFIPSYYYTLDMAPGERMFRVETENAIGPKGGGFSEEKRAGVIVLAANGAEAAETGSQLLGLPVTELTAKDVTGGLDLDDLTNFVHARWHTKEQIAAAKAAQAGRELAMQRSAAAAQDNTQPAASSAEQPNEPRSVFSRDTQQPAAPQPNPAAAEAGTFIVTYLDSSGAQHQTAYDANSVNDAAQSFIAQHPRTYTVVSVEPHQEGEQSESLFNTLMGKKSVVDEEEVDEVNMSPGALADFAKTDAAKSIRVGWEAEMLVPGLGRGDDEEDDDDYEYEPNYDEDTGINFDRSWRDQIRRFWRDGDYNNHTTREIDRAIEEMDEQYQEYVDEQFTEFEESDEGRDAILDNIRENNDEAKELHSFRELGALDNFDDLYSEALDLVRDDWTTDFMRDDSNFISWAEDNSLDTMRGFADQYRLDWPYMTVITNRSSGGVGGMSGLASQFSKYSGYPTKAGSYSTHPDDKTGVFKDDSSIKRMGLDSNYSGVEFASAYRPYDESMDMLNKFYKWAGEIGAEANESCGFHVGVSVPDQKAGVVDNLKFILFLGDRKVLEDFGREASSWCKSSLSEIITKSRNGRYNPEEALEAFRQGLDSIASNMARSRMLPSGDRYVSVNYKDKYIEIRSAGGDFFSKQKLITDTINRYVRVLALAADPAAEKQEYYKKIYKAISTGISKDYTDTVKNFALYAAGQITRPALKSLVKQAQGQRKRDREIKAATAPATGLHGAGKWEIYKILRRADDFEVHEFMAPNADQAQYKLEQWARATSSDIDDYTVVKANQQPNQQDDDFSDIDLGTWEPEPEPQMPARQAQPAQANIPAWSPSARIAYQLVDRAGNPIAYFTDGTRMPTNSLFYAANSDEASRRAADLDRIHGLPMGYLVRPFGGPGGGGPGGGIRESFIKSSIARAILAEEEVVDEVTMNPSAFQAFLGTEAAAKMTMGFEAEMCVKNLDTSRSVSATPRIPEDVDITAVYPFDPAGQKRYYEFWTQEDANTEDAVASALERLKARMDQWMSTHAEGEEITSDHWRRFLRGGGYRRWENMAQVNEVLGLRWPYGNTNDRLSRDDLKNDFTASTGYEAVMFSGYHSAEKPKDKFVFEFDSSIRPNPGDGAQELVSYAMPLPQAIEALDKMFAWANSKGYVYANSSTGFHVNVGMAGNTPDKIDTLKLLMLMGDQKILKDFGRDSNSYCESMMSRVVRKLASGYTGQGERDELLQNLKTKTWDGLRKLASRFVDRAQSGDKFVSVNNKGKYIEFRGPGGDWMSQQDKMRNTILQVSRAYAMAADPVEGQQDYLKKVYKLLSGMDENRKDDRLQVFADWSMGKISNEELATQLRARRGIPAKATSTAAASNEPDRYVIVNGGRVYATSWYRLNPEEAQAWAEATAEHNDELLQGVTYYVMRGGASEQGEGEPIGSVRDGRFMPRPTQTAQAAPQPARRVVDTGEYSENILASLPPELANAQGWELFDESGDEVDSFTATAREAVSIAQDYSSSNPEYTFSLERDRYSMTFATFGAGRVYYAGWVVAMYGQNPAAASAVTQPASQARTAPAAPADDDEDLQFDVTYRGRNNQVYVTVITADDEEDARQQFRANRPTANLVSVQPHRTEMEESVVDESAKLMDVLVAEESKRKPKKPKTIVDGALKTLIAKGRSEDEAIADLKKEIDKKFYTEEISETLKKVNGKWALVSRQDPKKVLQYYHGAGHPSKEWISKVERRVHSFSESASKPKVFVDLDGVLADFFGEWAKLEKVDHYKDIIKKKGPENMDAAFDLIRKHPTFWTDLPLLPHAMELIRFVKENFGEYYILSKPLERDPRCEAGKRAWVRMHLQDIPPERVLLTANKAQYARAGGDANILIDDYGVNIDHWREAGGIAIKYEPKDFHKVKKILKGLTNDE